MSLKSEVFYAIACDFPECTELYDSGEYSYWADPYYGADGAMDAGWLISGHGGGDHDYCPAHVIEVECPPETIVTEGGETFCQWCEDNGTGVHLIPMADTFENRLKVIERRVVERAHWRLDQLERDLIGSRHGKLGDLGSYAQGLTRELDAIHERTCRAWKPEITSQELFDLKHGRKR